MRLASFIKRLKVEILISHVLGIIPFILLSVTIAFVPNNYKLFISALLCIYSLLALAILPKVTLEKLNKIENNCIVPIEVLQDVISDFRQTRVFKKRLSQVTNIEEIDSVLIDIEKMASELSSFHQDIQDKNRIETAFSKFNADILKTNSYNDIYSLVFQVVKNSMNAEMGALLFVEKDIFREYMSWGNNAPNKRPFYSTPSMCPALRNGSNCTSNEVYAKDGCDHCFPINNNRQSSLCHTFEKNGVPYIVIHLAHSKAHQFKSYHMEMLKRVEQSVNSRLKQIETTEDFQTKAYTDKLTGLKNKHYIVETIEGYIANNQPFSMQVYDIDSFKKINDTHGHLVGDFVLKTLGQILESHVVQGKSFAGRYGGEEFLVITLGDQHNEAIHHAESIRRAIEGYEFKFSEDLIIPVTSSIGVSFYQGPGDTFESMFKRADDALYQAKKTGKNKVMFYK